MPYRRILRPGIFVPVAERKLTFQNLLLFTTDDTLLSDSPSHLAQLQDPEAGSNLAHSGGYSVVTSTLVTFRVQTRPHSMIERHQDQFLFIVTRVARLWDSPTNYDDSIFSLSCAKSTKLSFLKALLQRFLRFFDPNNIPLRRMQQDSSTIVSGSTGVITTLISSTTFPTSTRPANQEEIANERLIWFNPPYSKNVKTNVAKNF